MLYCLKKCLPYPSDPSESANRPRLKLQPRTKPTEQANKAPAPERSSSIFGNAKPVDTAAREREIEDKLQKQKDFDHERWEQEKENRARYLGHF